MCLCVTITKETQTRVVTVACSSTYSRPYVSGQLCCLSPAPGHDRAPGDAVRHQCTLTLHLGEEIVQKTESFHSENETKFLKALLNSY